MAEQPETRLQRKAVEAINKIEGAYAEKVHGSMFGKAKLDIFGAYQGKMFYLEAKVPGKKPTPRQYATMKLWKDRARIKTGWFTTPEQAVEIVLTMQN